MEKEIFRGKKKYKKTGDKHFSLWWTVTQNDPWIVRKQEFCIIHSVHQCPICLWMCNMNNRSRLTLGRKLHHHDHGEMPQDDEEEWCPAMPEPWHYWWHACFLRFKGGGGGEGEEEKGGGGWVFNQPARPSSQGGRHHKETQGHRGLTNRGPVFPWQSTSHGHRHPCLCLTISTTAAKKSRIDWGLNVYTAIVILKVRPPALNLQRQDIFFFFSFCGDGWVGLGTWLVVCQFLGSINILKSPTRDYWSADVKQH